MNFRATSLLTLPALALLAASCATTNQGVVRSTEVDDVYFTSADRLASRYQQPATYDPTAPPAADGSVPNPDYNGQAAAGQTNYYDDGAYAASPRVTSPYYGSVSRYNSGYAYDPFWAGSSLAIGCGPGWGYYGPSAFAYAPIYAGPRVRFGVSFGYGWGYSAWAAPMYGWAGPTFYDPFYDPFWGPSYGYGYGYGYPSYGYGGYYGGGFYGGGWRNGYRQGFYDGMYASGGGIRNGRRVVYGPRLDRSGAAGTTAYSAGGRTSRTGRPDGGRTVTPGTSNYQPAYNSYSGYGGGATKATRASRVATSYPTSNYSAGQVSAPTYPDQNKGAIRATRSPQYVAPNASPAPQPATRGQYEYAAPSRQSTPPTMADQPVPRSQPQPQVAPPAREQRSGGWFQRSNRAAESSPRPEAPTRTYSAPAQRAAPSGNFGGGVRSSGGSSGGARRSR